MSNRFKVIYKDRCNNTITLYDTELERYACFCSPKRVVTEFKRKNLVEGLVWERYPLLDEDTISVDLPLEAYLLLN